MKKIKKVLLVFILLLTVLGTYGCIKDTRAIISYESPSEEEQLYLDLISQLENSVVAVNVTTPSGSGHGSGTIFKKESLPNAINRYYVLTNHHVVKEATEISIYVGPNQRSYPAKDYQSNSLYDVAVVRFETSANLDSKVKSINVFEDDTISLEILKGQSVIAIGTPYEMAMFNFVSTGKVTLDSYSYNNVNGLGIMHDAALNPGNSGGPLFNLKGEVIGVNVAKTAWVKTENDKIAAEHLSYALNINKLAPIVNGFSSYNSLTRTPKLGITVTDLEAFKDAYPDTWDRFVPSNKVGVVIIDIDGSRDSFEKLYAYDLIVEIDGDQVETVSDVSSHIANGNFGDEKVIKVYRWNGTTQIFEEVTVTVELS